MKKKEIKKILKGMFKGIDLKFKVYSIKEDSFIFEIKSNSVVSNNPQKIYIKEYKDKDVILLFGSKDEKDYLGLSYTENTLLFDKYDFLCSSIFWRFLFINHLKL